MAYVFRKHKKDPRAYLYAWINGKATCVKPLGVIGEREAEKERIQWMANHGKGDYSALDMSMEVVWQQYNEYLVTEGYAPKTIKCANYCVHPFVKTMAQLNELTAERIESWNKVLIAWTYQRGENGEKKKLTTESRAHKLRAISSFCGWLTDVKHYFKESPFKTKIPAQREDAGRALAVHEIRSVLENWPTVPYRRHTLELLKLSKLFFQIVFSGGTRLTELLGENDDCPGGLYENLDRKNLILKLDDTKAGVSREIALPKVVVDLIPNGSGPIFYNKISDTCLRNHLRKACQNAGIKGRFRIHDGRVSSATEWIRKNGITKNTLHQYGWKGQRMPMHYDKGATKQRIDQAQDMGAFI